MGHIAAQSLIKLPTFCVAKRNIFTVVLQFHGKIKVNCYQSLTCATLSSTGNRTIQQVFRRPKIKKKFVSKKYVKIRNNYTFSACESNKRKIALKHFKCHWRRLMPSLPRLPSCVMHTHILRLSKYVCTGCENPTKLCIVQEAEAEKQRR